MKKHPIARILAIVLSAAFLLTILPVMQAAAETEIATLTVSQAEPFGGFRASDSLNNYYIDFDGYSPGNNTFTQFSWTDAESPDANSDWRPVADDQRFEPGTTYAKSFWITLSDASYKFAPANTLKVEDDSGHPVEIVEAYTDSVEFMIIYDDVKGFSSDSYRLAVGDTFVTPKNASDILGNGTAKYDPDTATLTLKNATINTAYAEREGLYEGIAALDDLTIVLEGANTIDLSALDTRDAVYGISAYRDLTIKGSGSLTVNAGDATYYTAAVDASRDIYLFPESNWRFMAGAIESFGDESLALSASKLYLEPMKAGATVNLSARSGAISGSFSMTDCSVKANTTFGDALTEVTADAFLFDTTPYREVKLTAEEPADYDLIVGGVTVTEANKNNILGDGTAKYDPATRTLTLNKAKLSAAYIYNSSTNEAASIFTGKPLTINLIGDNVIDTTGADAYPATTYWAGLITSESYRLDITGDGSLALNAGTTNVSIDGIWIGGGRLTVNNRGNFSVTGADETRFWALYNSTGSVSLNVGGKLTISQGNYSGAGSSDAIYAYYDIDLTVGKGSTATIKSGNSSSTGFSAIYSNTSRCGVSIHNEGNLTISSGDMYDDSIAIYSEGFVNITNTGTMTVTAGDADDDDSYAIYANDVANVTNTGTMTVTAGDSNDDSDAFEVYTALRIFNDGTMNVTAGDGYFVCALYSGGDLTLGGNGTYNLETGDGTDYVECVCGKVVDIVDGATVTVTGGKAGGDSYGIDSEIAQIATSGDVTVTLGKTEDYSYGIAGDVLSLYGPGDVTVTLGKCDYGRGLYAGAVTVDGPGNVFVSVPNATTEGYGLVSNIVNATFAGTNIGNTIYIEGNTTALFAPVEFDADFYAVKASVDLPAELEAVGLNVTNYNTFKAIEWTSLVKTVEDTAYGDANSDGSVDMKDVLLIRKYIANLVDKTALNLANADANGDGDINMKDVLYIRQFIANLRASLGPET